MDINRRLLNYIHLTLFEEMDNPIYWKWIEGYLNGSKKRAGRCIIKINIPEEFLSLDIDWKQMEVELEDYSQPLSMSILSSPQDIQKSILNGTNYLYASVQTTYWDEIYKSLL